MLERIKVEGFKSLRDIDVELAPLVVVWGPNAVGKSNLLEAILLLGRIVTERTLADAFEGPIRGWPTECFTLPRGGLPELLRTESVRLRMEADLAPAARGGRPPRPLRYRVEVELSPGTGALRVTDEYLTELKQDRSPLSKPRIERVSDEADVERLIVRRTREQGRPNLVELGANHALVSNLQFSGDRFRAMDTLRREVGAWRGYYLDPRTAMRAAMPPSEVEDIGPLGQYLAPFLYRLRSHDEFRPRFDAVRRTLHSAIPAIERLDVTLDEKRGNLDVEIVDRGTPYSLRVVSEGTLRVLALCALAANPWPSRLVAFEEPENGVHPQRVEVVARLLQRMSRDRQVVVSTHSPVLLEALALAAQETPDAIRFFVTRRAPSGTVVERWQPAAPLFLGADRERIHDGLSDDKATVGMATQGWLDA